MHKVTKFRDETIYLLNNRPQSLSLSQISRDLVISEGWLSKFANGKIDNAGVVTVESLNVYLKNKMAK